MKMESRESGKEFIPYQQIQTDITPPKSIVIESFNEIDNNHINDFYDELEEFMDKYRDEIDPNDHNFDYSKRKQYNVHKQLNLPIKIIQDPVISQTQGRLFSRETDLAMEQMRIPRSFYGNQSYGT
ncbi:hypothetical protein BEWA_043580 [Theileria equi strain WA]|uniref:Uncharacterized protein n=1 Tax=Theileria equi strain WA TaxID=1537102 RepID=L1LFW8_THEEQ|nr:hypothetical protein BEWA_043580 [Theileria equi strain WA]EKX74317.1 hypothetical protein BEWA_043580 [Theileria equi strain WA]|eukprot:XP_004833769.1 hypothetical protein BEWA_043580 [Theileria equi strain WA]